MKALLLLLTFLAGSFATLSQTINVLEKTKISHTHDSLSLSLVNNGQFGSVADISNLTPGVYAAIVFKPDQQYHFRFVKE